MRSFFDCKCPVQSSHKMLPRAFRQQAQKGTALIVGLIFLIILTLLGVSAATMSTADERMARNSRDRNIAFQAAEAAIRDAHLDISSRTSSGVTGAAGASDTCNATGFTGYCLPAAVGMPQIWEGGNLEDANKSVQYGAVSGATTALFSTTSMSGGVTKQPRYMIEPLPDSIYGSTTAFGKHKWVYRVTSIGYGSMSGTTVILQEVFRP